MNGAKELLKIYGDLSNTHHADNTDLDDLQKLIDKTTAWEKGSNTDKNGSGGGQADNRRQRSRRHGYEQRRGDGADYRHYSRYRYPTIHPNNRR